MVDVVVACNFLVLFGHFLVMRADFILITVIYNAYSEPLALFGKLFEALPIPNESGSEHSVPHLTFMLLGLVPVAEAPTGSADIFAVVVRVVRYKHFCELFDIVL
jgi:hypothetical protein